ncbi:unnamed protein product [Lymnaea stagnalis]|uniref:C-type lectin domain-containing protein n=1 Tax=Lymnaea stagnalis TaxID=6523 RepID=A0AAV2H1R1_LYMST
MIARLTAFIWVTSFLFSEQTEVDDACPPGLPQDEFRQLYRDSCFYFVLYRVKDYVHAEQDCEGQGGKLAVVDSAAVQGFLVDKLVNAYKRPDIRVWIGLEDRDNDGTFVWADGTPLAYSNWAIGEGDHKHPGEVCALLDTRQRGKWYDFVCENKESLGYEHSYVCQYTSRTATAPTAHVATATDISMTHPCPPFSCDLDCGMDGFKKNGTSSCSLCECDV